MESCVPHDWHLATVICKALWNFSEPLSGSNSARTPRGLSDSARNVQYSSEHMFGESNAAHLLELLTALTDEDYVRRTCDAAALAELETEPLDANVDQKELADAHRATIDYLLSIWREEYQPVASALLEKVESHSSPFETI